MLQACAAPIKLPVFDFIATIGFAAFCMSRCLTWDSISMLQKTHPCPRSPTYQQTTRLSLHTFHYFQPPTQQHHVLWSYRLGLHSVEDASAKPQCRSHRPDCRCYWLQCWPWTRSCQTVCTYESRPSRACGPEHGEGPGGSCQ
jgi:hypothetical protein